MIKILEDILTTIAMVNLLIILPGFAQATEDGTLDPLGFFLCAILVLLITALMIPVINDVARRK